MELLLNALRQTTRTSDTSIDQSPFVDFLSNSFAPSSDFTGPDAGPATLVAVELATLWIRRTGGISQGYLLYDRTP